MLFRSTNGDGVRGVTGGGNGVYAFSTGGDAIEASTTTGRAGNFLGNVRVTGSLTKGSGSFQIDHPLDPANKYLNHASVESSEMMNLYNGIVTLDAHGEAVVHLPAWFEVLNTQFRYQLTCIGGFAPVYVAEKIQSNRFKIAGGAPGLEVSWQVTGVRQDAYAAAHPIVIEEDKPDPERGHYLFPELFDQPMETGIGWLNHLDLLQDLQQMTMKQPAEHNRYHATRAVMAEPLK